MFLQSKGITIHQVLYLDKLGQQYIKASLQKPDCVGLHLDLFLFLFFHLQNERFT